MGAHGDDLRLHEIPDQHIIVLGHQFLGGDGSDQFPALCDIAGVDGLLMDAGFLNVRHGLGNCHSLAQIHILRGHDASGAVVRIVEKLVDFDSRIRGYGVQDTADQIGRQFLEDIHGVIHVQVIEQLFQLFFREDLHQTALHGRIHIGEHFCSLVLGDQTEGKGKLLVFKFREK